MLSKDIQYLRHFVINMQTLKEKNTNLDQKYVEKLPAQTYEDLEDFNNSLGDQEAFVEVVSLSIQLNYIDCSQTKVFFSFH